MSGGQQITVGQGILGPSSHGQVIISGQGILTASGNSNTVSLSGYEITSQQGTLTVGATLLSGSAITGSAGSFGISRDRPISGSSFTASAGTMIAGQEADDTYIAGSAGLTAAGFNIALSGLESTMGQGTVGFSQGLLVGSSATFSQQSFPAFIIAPRLTGRSISVGQGTLTQIGGSPPVEATGSGGSNGKRRYRKVIKYSDYPSRMEYMKALQEAVYIEPEYVAPAPIPITKIDMNGKILADAPAADTSEDDEIIKAVLLMKL